MALLLRKPQRSYHLLRLFHAAATTSTSCNVLALYGDVRAYFEPITTPLNPDSRSFATFSSFLSSDSEPVGGSQSLNSADEKAATPAATAAKGPSSKSKEADRISKVLDELLASDGSMEAALDACDVALTCDLVVSVLERLRHSHKPAYRFFRWAAGRPGFAHNAESYNNMLGVLGKARQLETMFQLLDEMGKKGFLSTDGLKIAVKALASTRETKRFVDIFQLLKRHDFEVGLETFNGLIEVLAKSKLGKDAQALFDEMKDQHQPDLRTYTLLLLGWCNSKNLAEARRVWDELLDKGFQPDVVAYNTLLDGLIRSNRRSEALELFELMKAKGLTPNVRTYTILIQDLCRAGNMGLAMHTFNEMVTSGCPPDVVSYTCLVVGFGNAGKMDMVSSLLLEMTGKGCPPDSVTYNALIKQMINHNMPDEAACIYEKMINDGLKPTVHTYNMMMKSYFHRHKYEMGCAVWEEMNHKGICPDANSYAVFIGAHIRYGMPEKAYRYIDEMISKGMKPPQIDYKKFASEFSRAGKTDMLSDTAEEINISRKFENLNVCHGSAEIEESSST